MLLGFGLDLGGISKQYDFCQSFGQDAVGGSDVAFFAAFGEHNAAGIGFGTKGKSFK